MPSIKYNILLRRRKKLQSIISFTAETEFSDKKEDFLSCDKNKTGTISIISTALRKWGYHVIQPPGDADADIVKATVLNNAIIIPQHWLMRIRFF